MIAMDYLDAVFKDGSADSTIDPELLEERKQLDNLRAVVSQMAYHVSSLYILMAVIMLAVILVVVVQVSFALYTLMMKKRTDPHPSHVVFDSIKNKTESKKKEEKTDRSRKNLPSYGQFSPGKLLPATETKINVDFDEMDKEVTTAVAPHNQGILEALGSLARSILSNSESSAQKSNSITTAAFLPTSFVSATRPALHTAVSGQISSSTK